MLKDMMFGDNGWISSIKDAVVKGILTVNGQMDNPLLGRLAGELSGTATDSATKTLSSAGEQIANAGGGGFSLDGGVKVSLGAELTWQKGKGLNFRVQICTNSSTSIGFGENKVSITKNDPLIFAECLKQGSQPSTPSIERLGL